MTLHLISRILLATPYTDCRDILLLRITPHTIATTPFLTIVDVAAGFLTAAVAAVAVEFPNTEAAFAADFQIVAVAAPEFPTAVAAVAEFQSSVAVVAEF